MAAVDKWRMHLNERSFCKSLRENNATESKKSVNLETKSLIVVDDNDLLIWDNTASHLIFYKLQNLSEVSDRKDRYQTLKCTDSPRFSVDWLVWNITKTHLALWGQLGVTVLELPQKYGKYAEYQGGRDVVSCKSVSVGEHYFSSHQGVRLLQLSWHPASLTDTHVVILTSDNLISIYDIVEPERPVQVLYLGDTEPSYPHPLSRPSISGALGDCVMGFDFGPDAEVQRKTGPFRSGKAEKRSVWPIYCIQGNGDVMVAFSDLSERPAKLPVQGPLLMHPPAEDNYGNDACAILCLPTTPTVVVISTCEGRLHHCVLLPKDQEDTSVKSESSFSSTTEDVFLYQSPDEMLLYVTESVELELSLTTPQIAGVPAPEDIFTCPIRLIHDTTNQERYHCAHAAGVHTLVLPWVNSFQTFCSEEAEEDMLPAFQNSIVEHLICTKPLPNSPPSPVFGIAQVRDSSIGTRLLTLSNDYQFHCLRLSDMRYITNDTALLSDSRGRAIPSPLRKISREPFDDRIRRILKRTTSNPLLKSGADTQMSQQECFQLLSRATQVFREEYIQKQDLARQEIKRRVSILKEQKSQQDREIQALEESRNILSDNAEKLANSCEECKEKQEDILKRIENIMRKLQARIPFLSEPERSMKRELENMEEKLETYKRSLEQLKVKREYQERQMQQGSRSNQPSPLINKNQVSQLREVLKQEGDEVAALMKKLSQLKMDANI